MTIRVDRSNNLVAYVHTYFGPALIEVEKVEYFHDQPIRVYGRKWDGTHWKFKMDEEPFTLYTRDLFAKAQKDRDEGMAQAEAHSGEIWAAYCDDYIEKYAREHPTLFVDELWASGLMEPISPRALGPRILSASLRGIIERSGMTRPSVRSRMGHKPVWKSLIYEGRAQ